MDRERARARLAHQERNVVGLQANLLGKALRMYAADHDGQLPPADAVIKRVLAPYLPGVAAPDALVYAYGGGALRDVRDPRSTVLGYVTGEYWRALAYADGHVQWERK